MVRHCTRLNRAGMPHPKCLVCVVCLCFECVLAIHENETMPAKRQGGLSMYLASKGAALTPKHIAAKASNPKARRNHKPKGKKTQHNQHHRRVAPPVQGGLPDVRHFQMALRNPFSPMAIGARVVDSFTTPTVTYHIRGYSSLTSSSSGRMYFAVLPSPCFSYLQPTSGNGGPSDYTNFSGFTQNNPSIGGMGGAYVTAPSNLASVMTEYRTVAWGFRLIAKDTAFNSKGKVYVASVPTTENAPSWNTMETVTGTDTSIGEYTVGLPLANIGGILNLPGCQTFSMQDLLRGEVMFCGTPTNASFYQFKGTMDRSVVAWNTGQVLADEGVFNHTTGLVNATAGGRKDIASLRGGRAFLVCATGLPASTQELDLEVVYHLEGTPNITSSGTAQLVPSSMRSVGGSTSLVESAISLASNVNTIYQYLKDPIHSAAAATKALSFLRL